MRDEKRLRLQSRCCKFLDLTESSIQVDYIQWLRHMVYYLPTDEGDYNAKSQDAPAAQLNNHVEECSQRVYTPPSCSSCRTTPL
jgi:hypothetical protein